MTEKHKSCNICYCEIVGHAHRCNIRKWELVHERTLELILSPPLNKRCVRPRPRVVVEGKSQWSADAQLVEIWVPAEIPGIMVDQQTPF